MINRETVKVGDEWVDAEGITYRVTAIIRNEAGEVVAVESVSTTAV